MLQFNAISIKVFSFFYKIERAVEIKGAGGALVFAISKRFNSFSAFFTKSREQLKSKVQGVLQFLQIPKDSTVFQLFYKIKGAGDVSVFEISKRFSGFFTKSRE
jgi:hypothetical protein